MKKRSWVNYKSYIKSPAWKKKRETYKRFRPWVCLCGETKNLHLHHKTYERLGHEALDDLQPLCPECHKLVHQMVDAGEMKIDLKGFYSFNRSKPVTKKTIQEIRQDHAASLAAQREKKSKEKRSARMAKNKNPARTAEEKKMAEYRAKRKKRLGR